MDAGAGRPGSTTSGLGGILMRLSRARMCVCSRGKARSIYAKPGFEVVKILNILELVTDTSLLLVEWQEFDP